MTAQIPETLRYNGKELSMCSQPLDQYFELAGVPPPFVWQHTALWRGYVGEWELVAGRLYLIRLEGSLPDGQAATLETIFPGFSSRVFAHWYTGTVSVREGEMLEYVHMGYASTYERSRFIEIRKGVVTKEWVRDNKGQM